MKLYLDNCCFNRLYDSQTTNKILMETSAKLRVQDEIRTGKHELVGSYMLVYENEQIPNEMKKQTIRAFQKQYSTQYVSFELRESLIAKIDEIRIVNPVEFVQLETEKEETEKP